MFEQSWAKSQPWKRCYVDYDSWKELMIFGEKVPVREKLRVDNLAMVPRNKYKVWIISINNTLDVSKRDSSFSQVQEEASNSTWLHINMLVG
jgi:hypothetical protein